MVSSGVACRLRLARAADQVGMLRIQAAGTAGGAAGGSGKGQTGCRCQVEHGIRVVRFDPQRCA